MIRNINKSNEYLYVIKSRYNQELKIVSNCAEISGQDCIILSHGFYTDSNALPIGPLYDSLKDSWKVFKFDFVGKGANVPTYSECVSDLFDVLAFLAVKKPKSIKLIGHSLGAVISLVCANKFVDYKLIDRVILLGLPYETTGFYERYHIKPLRPNDEKKQALIQGHHVWISREFLLDLFRYDIINELSKIEIPITFIYGDRDKVITKPQIKELYKTCFSNASKKSLKRRKKVIFIPSTAHLFRGKKAQNSLFLNVTSALMKTYGK